MVEKSDKNDLPNKNPWDDLAETYQDQVLSLTSIKEKRDRLLPKIIKPGKVLIPGCGSETYLQRDLLNRNGVVTVTALDFSHRMLEVAENNFSHERLTYQHGDMTDLPFADKSFDYVISSNSIVPETREEVLAMYGEIYRVLKDGGIFSAALPSFPSAVAIAMNFPDRMKEFLDLDTFRVKDTVGWQAFHTRLLIHNELGAAGFQNIKPVSIGAESKAEKNLLIQIYGSIGQYIWEYYVTATKPLSIPKNPDRIKSVSNALLVSEGYNAEKITPELISEVSDFYRYIFNNNGHFLVFPEAHEFISPQEYFGRQAPISLDEMDGLKTGGVYHRQTQEEAILWHDPEATKQAISQKISTDSRISVLRREDSQEIAGMVLGRKATLKDMFALEGWENPFLFSGLNIPDRQRDIDVSLEKFNDVLKKQFPEFRDLLPEKSFTSDTHVYSANAIAVSPEYQGTGYLAKMTKHFLSSIPEEDMNSCFVLGETLYNSKAHQMFRAGGVVDVPGILNNSDQPKHGDPIICFAPLKIVNQLFSLDIRSFRKTMLQHARLRKDSTETKKNQVVET